MAVPLFTRFINLRNLVNVNNINAFGAKANLTQRLSTTPRCQTEITDVNFDEDHNASNNKPKKKMSAAMRVYLKRSQEYNQFMQKEIIEYNIGKRHLANIMGMNPETFNQRDINRSIAYLFPSGLYDKQARPMMAHPKKLFPPKKAAEFDETGRPHHSMFYTTKPNYYQALYNIVDALEELNKEEDKLLNSGKYPDVEHKTDNLMISWLSHKELERTLLETVSPKHYDLFIATLEKLINHPLSSYAENIIKKYQKQLQRAIKDVEVLPLKYYEDGTAYIYIRNISIAFHGDND